MYCPECGTQDNLPNQFCRACGADLRSVRTALERPDAVTSSAVSARQEIGRAFADRIRNARSKELSEIAEEILPEVEKFLESPEERRMRRLRYGSIIGFIGFGVIIAFSIIAFLENETGFWVLAGMGFVTLFIGISFMLNGIFLSVPKRSLEDHTMEGETQRTMDGAQSDQDLLMPQGVRSVVGSVTEGTTRNLDLQESELRGREPED